MKLLQLSVWSMLHAFISVAPWFLFFVAIEHLGKTELAISNITRSVSTLFFVIVNSFASTTGSLVSNLIGGGQGTFSRLPQSSQIRLYGGASIDTDSSLGQSMDHRILYE